MTLESPPRLKGGELGPILRAADAPVSADALASNHAAIKAAIAAGVTRTLPLWIKLGLPLLLVVGGYVAYRVIDAEAPPPPPAPVIVATVPVDAAPMIAVDAEIAIDAAEIAIDAAVVAAPKKKAAPPPVVVVEPPPPPPQSALPAQIALYEQARAAAARGEVTRGIELIDELFATYPATQLRAEAELTRAELLTRANRLGDAGIALEALVASDTHRGRRGELLRALGDVRRKQGDCPRAVTAYTAARALSPNPAELVKIDRGLERCKKP